MAHVIILNYVPHTLPKRQTLHKHYEVATSLLETVTVKCTVVQALRLCTGCTARRRSRVIGKGKVHRCRGTEALYRLYGPQGEYRYSSILS